MHKTEGKLPLFKFEKLAGIPGLFHFITTRAGGVSLPPYHSLNLGLHTADNSQLVRANRALLATGTGIAADKFLYASQVHSGDVLVVDEKAISNGVFSKPPETDAMITALPGICLMVMVADCVPVLLFDPVRKVSAAIHAGWRGTVQEITANAINAMVRNFGCKPSGIIAGIGPSIGPCCYEVGEEVNAIVAKKFNTTKGYLVSQQNTPKSHFDLWYANAKQLTDCGVKPENIETAELCTLCKPDILFSSRAADGITGRFAAGICIRE
jgi:YfiH family protein